MSQEITLMCRQVESSDIIQNGVYNTTLDRPITLEAGDQVSIKSATLNVVQDSIRIPVGGLDVELQGLKYLVNYNINRYFNYRAGNSVHDGVVAPLFNYGGTAPSNAATNPPTGDNELYWLANANANSAAHTPYYILNVAVVPLTKGRGGKRYGGDLLLRYTDPATPDKVLQSKVTCHIPSYQEDEYEKHNPIPLPEDARKKYPTHFFQVKCADIGGKPSIEVDPSMELFTINVLSVTFPEDPAVVGQPITPATDSYEISPQTFTWKATIPEGDYTPLEMAGILTNLLAPVEVNGPTSANYNHNDGGAWDEEEMEFGSTSPFLETILQNQRTLNRRTAATPNTTNQMCFTNASRPVSLLDPSLADNAGTIAQKFSVDAMKAEYNAASTPFVAPLDRWVGTDSISISFDENENKMKFDVAHFPVYVNSTGGTPGSLNADAKPGIVYNETPADASSVSAPSGLAKAYSGVAFTAMSPQSFWETSLGFSNNTVVVNPNSVVCNFPIDSGAVQNSFTVSNVIAGQTITEAFAGLSVPVINSSDRQYAPGTLPGGDPGPVSYGGEFAQPISTTTGVGTGAEVTVADTVAMFGGKTFNQELQNAGYFLIDVANNFQTDFVGNRISAQTSSHSTNGQDTMSIVSRYYTSNNYLTNQGPGNVVYTHPEGALPQLLTELKIRVKNPDGSFVSEGILGDENTVFVSIDRAPRPVNVPSSPQPKEK